jgi:hypothetical protein
MMAILDHTAAGVIVLGMFAIAIGFFLALSISLRVAHAQPDFWRLHWGSFRERMQIRSRVGAIAREKENTTRSGSIADWFLKRGTVLLVIGGITKAVLFFIERQSP